MPELLKRLQDSLEGQYTIERELGRGAMGIVYLARDTRHEREVAVKVLDPDLVSGTAAPRFLREIKVAAQLSHPNILPLHDSGEADGLIYYVMPFVEGETVRDRLSREGQLPMEDALRITQEIGEGLAHAHAKGLVHRDIKPANIMLLEGHALLADFGLAGMLEDEGDDRLTRSGVSIGTPFYMSPEQWNSSNVDARSDQYALACVLYEMLAGEPPFTGATPQVVLARHSMDAVPSLRAARANVPESVEGAVVRAMAKVPADRFGSVEDFVAGLETATLPAFGRVSQAKGSAPAWRRLLATVGAVVLVAALAYFGWTRLGPSSAGGDRTRLVVLPFQNYGEAEDQYLADGVTDEITGRLAGIGTLGVIARTSAMQYRDTPKPVAEIAEELDVDYVIEGSIRWRGQGQGSAITVSAALIDVGDGTQVWGQDYDIALEELFAVQTGIAQQVAGALDLALGEPEQQRLAQQPTDNPEAYDYFLRGNAAYKRSWEFDDLETALEMYGRAVEIDSGFALAHAWIGRTHAWIHRLGYDATDSRLTLSRSSVDRALELEPELPEAHIALGLHYYWGYWDFESAIDHFLIARDLQPGNAELYRQIGNVRRRQGEWEEVTANYLRAGELDPRNYIVWHNLGETYTHVRQYEEAARHLRRVPVLAPDFLDGHLQMAYLTLHRDGDVTETRRILEEGASRLRPDEWRSLAGSWLHGLFRILYTVDEAREMMKPGVYGLDSASYHIAKAENLERSGMPVAARAQYDSALVHLEGRPSNNGLTDGMLGIAYAGQGRDEEAVEVARRAAELASQDAFDGVDWIGNLARVYMMIGDQDAAIAQLDLALTIPSRLSSTWLELDPVWDPLREHPRFQELVNR
jgi:serine/threonine-protein kinase